MITQALIKAIKTYQHTSGFSTNCCRFYPSCAEYSIQAIEKYGPIKGIAQSIIRILKCNQLFKGGYDPVK